jgi:alkanesulfonate monooxygenase SsuD/methylene tetrahydromethanopterin reductase-like flavin-dependent oxidoreductase (luciferase family)
MRRLWSGEEVTHDGLVTVREAKLYTLPAEPPPLFSAALSEGTAEDAGSWADGLVTTNRPTEELARLIGGFRAEGGEDKPVVVKVDVAWVRDEEEALLSAWEQWRGNSVGRELTETLRRPGDFDAASAAVRPDDMRDSLVLGPPDAHRRALDQLAHLGVDRVIVHDVTPEQERFIAEFGESVLGKLE